MTIQLSRRTAIALGFAFSFSAHAGAAPMRIGTIGAGRMAGASAPYLLRPATK